MPDSTAISRAFLTLLQQDAALHALLPDGIYKNVAKPGSTRFGLVDVTDGDDRAVFGGRAIESVVFSVKAVMLSTVTGDLQGAADRIDALCREAVFPVPGYVFVSCYRDHERSVIDYDDEDRVDTSIRYRNLGGHYRVTCSWPDK
jgi:hypothetical protein